MDFSTRVITAREHAKLTQDALARAVGVSQQAIQKLEGGAKSSRNTTKIAIVCGVRPEWLASGDPPMLLADTASQLERLDTAIIRAAIILAKRSMKLGADEELLIERDPDTFAQALRTAIAQRERLEAEHGVRPGSGDGEAGTVGSVESTPEGGKAAQPAVGGGKKRASG